MPTLSALVRTRRVRRAYLSHWSADGVLKVLPEHVPIGPLALLPLPAPITSEVQRLHRYGFLPVERVDCYRETAPILLSHFPPNLKTRPREPTLSCASMNFSSI